MFICKTFKRVNTRSMSYKKRSKRWSSLDFGVFVQSFLIFHDRRGQVVSKFIFSFLVCFLKEMGTGLVSRAFSGEWLKK